MQHPACFENAVFLYCRYAMSKIICLFCLLQIDNKTRFEDHRRFALKMLLLLVREHSQLADRNRYLQYPQLLSHVTLHLL